jgi:tetratricopeptide (TPR) repeat protein
MAFIERVTGNLDTAWAQYEDALRGLQHSGDLVGEAHVLGNLAQILLERHEYEQAEALLARALDVVRDGGSRIEAQLLHRLGEVRRARDDLDGAEQAFGEVLRLARHDGDAVGEAYASHGLGHVLVLRGRFDEAKTTLNRALRLAEETEENMLGGKICLTHAELHQGAGAPDEAADWLRAALDLFERSGALRWRAKAQVLLNEVSRGDGGPDPAVAADR